MNKKKTKSMLIVALLLLAITIGYAVISSNLSINGTSIINKPTWDIHFENIQVKSGSITPSTAAHIVNSTGVGYARHLASYAVADDEVANLDTSGHKGYTIVDLLEDVL